jgi:Ca2+-binding EF-hand superfamily protein
MQEEGIEPDAIAYSVAILACEKAQQPDRARELRVQRRQAKKRKFKADFLTSAKRVFRMIDTDRNGTLEKAEIIRAVTEDKEVIEFLQTCGEPNLQFLVYTTRLEDALDTLDTSRDGKIDIQEWEVAINRGLEVRLQQLDEELDQKEAEETAAKDKFKADFRSAASRIFEMIDADSSGSIDKAELIRAVTKDQEVIDFLQNCGQPNLQYLLYPERIGDSLKTLDKSNDGELDMDEWMSAINQGLDKRLWQIDEQRARKEVEDEMAKQEFAADFLSAARKVFEMIDTDRSGTLEKEEIVRAVETNEEVIKFLQSCKEPNLEVLLDPLRRDEALSILDTSRNGELDIDEWEAAISTGLKTRLEQRADERAEMDREESIARKLLTDSTLSSARKVFEMIDLDSSGTIELAEILAAVQSNKAVIDFLNNCGCPELSFLLYPQRLEDALRALDTSKDGKLDISEWEAAINRSLEKVWQLEQEEREANNK